MCTTLYDITNSQTFNLALSLDYILRETSVMQPISRIVRWVADALRCTFMLPKKGSSMRIPLSHHTFLLYVFGKWENKTVVDSNAWSMATTSHTLKPVKQNAKNNVIPLYQVSFQCVFQMAHSIYSMSQSLKPII